MTPSANKVSRDKSSQKKRKASEQVNMPMEEFWRRHNEMMINENKEKDKRAKMQVEAISGLTSLLSRFLEPNQMTQIPLTKIAGPSEKKDEESTEHSSSHEPEESLTKAKGKRAAKGRGRGRGRRGK